MAGRIPQRFLDDLLDRVDIVDVIDRRVKLKKTGKNFSACCPFHDEKTPSFSVNPEKQFYYCFGCGAGGNALSFVMDYEKFDFPQAVENLAGSAGLEVPKEEVKPGTAAPVDSNKPLLNILERATQFYEQALRHDPNKKVAITYLKGRGLTGEVAAQFRLGYAPAGWDNLIKALSSSDADGKDLEKAGLVVRNDKGRVYDRFRERIVFPIVDQRGRIIAFGGRVLGDDKPKYLNSPETPVFHKSRELYGLYQARKNNRSLTRIVVVEGYMDVIALAQHGIGYAVATLGTSTSETHLEKLFRLVPEVIFCFDGDDAGRKAAFRALEAALPAMQDGRQARFLFLDEGEDPDSVVRKKGKEFLESRFDAADPLETFLFNSVAAGLDLATMDGRARFSMLAAPHLHRLPTGVFKTLMYQSLAERTGIDLESLKRLQSPPKEARVHQETTQRNDREQTAGLVDQYSRDSETTALDHDAYDAPPVDYDISDYGDGPPANDDAVPFDGLNGPEVNEDNSLAPSSRNPVHRILGLIALKPGLVLTTDLNQLPEKTRKDWILLLALIEHIQAQPDISTAALLGYWYGTPEGQLLTDLVGRETLTEEDGLQALYLALLHKLQKQPEIDAVRNRFEQLRQINYADLNAEQKRELLTLTQKLRALSGRK